MPPDIIDRLKPKQVQELSLIGKMLAREEDTTKLEKRWSAFIEESKHDIQREDINALVQAVLRESYMETSNALRFHSEKIEYFNSEKKQIRDHIKKIREDKENYLKSLEDKLQTLDDDAQLASIDLQNALQKLQQAIQAMSTVSKKLHDTAMAIIRKIG